MTDDYSGERGSSRTWVDAEIMGESMAAQRGGDSPPARSRTVDLGFEPNEQREADLVLLRALGEDSTSPFVGGLGDSEREAFENMLTLLTAPNRKYETLSSNQRAWAERRAKELEIDLRDPAERNRNVPRGREVAPAAVLQSLPMSPPGRRAAVDDLPLFNTVSTARAAAIQAGRRNCMVNSAPEQASISRGPLVGGPCPDCGKVLTINESGWACVNGHGYGEPNPPMGAPGPFEVEAGRAVIGSALPSSEPVLPSPRPVPGVVGARRRPAALGRPK